MLADELRYKLMRLLEANPKVSQRDVAREFGISLGKVNYCLKALIRKGWVKASHFKNSHNKLAYKYLLTRARHKPQGCVWVPYGTARHSWCARI